MLYVKAMYRASSHLRSQSMLSHAYHESPMCHIVVTQMVSQGEHTGVLPSRQPEPIG